MRLRGLLVTGLIAVTSLTAVSRGSTITTVDDSGAGTGAEQGTTVTAVDAAGDIAGLYVDTSNALHCFVRPAGGSISNCDVPGAGSGLGEGTFPTAINTVAGAYAVAGTYIDSNQISHGFEYTNGTFTKFDAPLASQSKNRGTTVTGINDQGAIIGTYTTGTYSTPSAYYGFMRSASGTFSSINAPLAGTGEGVNSKKQGTTPVAINHSGQVTGYYIDSSTVQHGFVLAANGSTYTVVDPTGVGTCLNHSNGTNFGGTTASGIDAAGDVAGTYTDASCVQHGFIRSAAGTYTKFDVTGADTSPCTTGGGSGEKICGTFLVLSDAAGDLTGSYIDTNGTIHGFLRSVETATFTTFDDPNAYGTGSLNGTLGISISSQTSGIEIVGTYLDANSELHGFVYVPTLIATTTTLTPVPTPNPSVYQEPVTLTASVSYSGGTPPNGENVTFLSGTTSLGTAQLTSGTASLTTTALPIGSDSITAAYGGDSDFAGSTSTAIGQMVNKASSSTTLTSSLNPSTFGQSVTLTANISGQFSGVATGTVTFYNGSASLGSTSVSSNKATWTTSPLPTGTDSITAVYSGDSNFAGSTAAASNQVVNKATPSITWATPAAITYGTALSATQLNATSTVAGTFAYTPPAGTVLSAGTQTLSVTLTPTDTTDYTTATTTVQLIVNNSNNPAPVILSLSPPVASAGGAAFALTVNGSGFVASSTVYWGTTALTTTYGSANQLTAQVPVTDIASAGINNITVQTPTPGGGTSNAFEFEVDSGSSGSGPTFTTLTASVAPGSTASYPVTLPSSATGVTVTCLNLPSGASCSYSSGSVTIATSASTPAGTYQITVVFTETLPGAASGLIFMPILLLPLVWARRRWKRQHIWIIACLGFVILAGAMSVGCGGSSNSQTHTATSSGAVTLNVQ
jgi:hypothetical protein